MAFDAGRGHVLVQGGEDGATFRSDTWALATPSPASYTSFGTGCGGAIGVPRLDAEPYRLPWLGDPFTVRASNVAPSAAGAFMFTGFSNTQWGSTPLPFALAPFGMSGCQLHVELFVVYPMTRRGNEWTWSLAIPTTPGLLGLVFYNQAIVVEPGANAAGAIVTAGAAARIGRR